MRNCCCIANPILASVRCEEITTTTLAIIGGVSAIVGAGVSVATSLISAGAQQDAAAAQAAADAQAAANAQAVAEYNAQIQEQNNELTYQLALQQASYDSQAAAANQQLALYSAQLAQEQAAAQTAFYEYSAGVSRANAEASQQLYEQQLQEVAATEAEAEARRAASQEETRRLREENEAQMSLIRAKYAGSGVGFEGSPLVVLSDAARLAETAVQDTLYIGELEARQLYRDAEIQEFEAGYTLLEKANYEAEAYAAETESFYQENLAAGQIYESQILALNYENQILAATYDTYVAEAARDIGVQQAAVTRFGGEVSSSNILAQSAADYSSAQADISATIGTGIATGISGVSSAFKSFGTIR